MHRQARSWPQQQESVAQVPRSKGMGYWLRRAKEIMQSVRSAISGDQQIERGPSGDLPRRRMDA